jgi:hypothetical protein
LKGVTVCTAAPFFPIAVEQDHSFSPHLAQANQTKEKQRPLPNVPWLLNYRKIITSTLAGIKV